MVSHRIPHFILIFCVLFTFTVGAGVSMNSAPSTLSAEQQTLRSPLVSESIGNYSLKQPTAPEQHSIALVGVDVGAAVTMEYREARGELGVHVVEREFTTGDPSTASLSLAEAATRVEERALELEAREQETRNAFLTEQITVQQYLREIAIIASEARLIEETISDLSPLVEESQNQARIGSQLATANSIIKGLSGPVSERVINIHQGQLSSNRVFISVESSSVLLATIQGDEYERELYRASDRSNGQSSDVGLIEAVSQFQNEYPGVAQAESGMDIGSVGGSDREIFTFRVQLPEGEMLLYYEQSTEKFYYESHNWMLDRVELDPGLMTVEANTQIVVNDSFLGGPLRISTRDNETNEPVSATVQIGDSQEIRSGADGVAWGIVPPGNYIITIETAPADETISIPNSRISGT